MATPIFQPVPSVMVVGSDDEVALACGEALPQIPVLRVAHAAAAVERMLVTRPLVVVVDGSLAEAGVAQVVSAASDIRAEVVRVAGEPRERLAASVREAALVAESHRAAT